MCITSCLMHCSYSIDTYFPGYFAQSSSKIIDFSLYFLYIIIIVEILFELISKIILFRWQLLITQDFQKIAEIEATMECYPVIPSVHDDSTGNQIFCKKLVWYTFSFMLFEVES